MRTLIGCAAATPVSAAALDVHASTEAAPSPTYAGARAGRKRSLAVSGHAATPPRKVMNSRRFN